MRRKRSKTTTRTVVISPSSSAMYIPVMSPCAPSNTSGFSNVKKAVPDVPSRLFVSFTSGTHVSTESRTKEIGRRWRRRRHGERCPHPKKSARHHSAEKKSGKTSSSMKWWTREKRERKTYRIIVLTIKTRVLWIKKKKKKKRNAQREH